MSEATITVEAAAQPRLSEDVVALGLGLGVFAVALVSLRRGRTRLAGQHLGMGQSFDRASSRLESLREPRRLGRASGDLPFPRSGACAHDHGWSVGQARRDHRRSQYPARDLLRAHHLLLDRRHVEFPPALVGGVHLRGRLGLVGLCPGPAIANLGVLDGRAALFVVSIIIGMGLYRGLASLPAASPPVAEASLDG